MTTYSPLINQANDNETIFDLDELESQLSDDLAAQLSNLEVLNEYRRQLGNKDNLVLTMKNIVLDQFNNQLAVQQAKNFKSENKGLSLDLRKKAHIQTTENFEQGVLATHNTVINYTDRYKTSESKFAHDENGKRIMKKDSRSGEDHEVLAKNARKPFDENRARGSASVHKDHTISAAEIIRDPNARTHLSEKEYVTFANSDKNLKDLDSHANMSKKDSSMTEFLDSERDGKKTVDRFNIDERTCRENDRIAREEFEEVKRKGKQESIKTGKESRRKEAFNIGGKALKSVLLQLLSKLAEEIFTKLALWLKEKKKNIKNLLAYIKSAISSFVQNLKKHIKDGATSFATTILSAIFGPIINIIRKIGMMFKQGYRSFKEALDYINDPQNKEKSIGILIAEIGKIIIVGLTALSAMSLGQLIESKLSVYPVFAFELPLIGSVASIIGLFAGGLVAGLIGALALNVIDDFIARKQRNELNEKLIDSANKTMETQQTIQSINNYKVDIIKHNTAFTIAQRHHDAGQTFQKSLDNITKSNQLPIIVTSENTEALNEMDDALTILLN